jgi:multimeric flavodoxin WrbA
MKAIILCGTLHKEGHSNTVTLSQFFARYLAEQQVEYEIIRLAAHHIVTGTYSDMDDNEDAWPQLLQHILQADIVIFATPIWWGSHSSEIQKVIERLDALHDKILKGGPSGLENKTGGIIITGDSDGAQHIIGTIGNFYNAIGLQLPPFATLSVMIKEHAKDQHPSEEQLLNIYEEKYDTTARKMAGSLLNSVKALSPNITWQL